MAGNKYVFAEIEIGSGRKGLVSLREDVAQYFGIAITTTSDVVVTRRRKAHSRSRFDGLTDTTATPTNVSASEWKTIKRASARGVGRAVKVPTKLKSGQNQQNTRYVTIRFPANAVVGAISEFLHTKIEAAKKPEFFIMETGAKYPVANVTGDVNPGEAPATAP
jgi:hypothetical protein